MREGRRIGILGGTFDPVHCGHIELGFAAQRSLALTQVLLVPANVPPHRPQPVASTFHRFAMVALAAARRPGWQASDLELLRGATSYTWPTLQELHRLAYMPTELFFILGADAFVDIETWRDYPLFLQGANFVVVSRPGFHVDDLPKKLPGLSSRMTRAGSGTRALPSDPAIILVHAATADVSSTVIRGRRASGEPITGLVEATVEQHIEQHGLYLAPTRVGGPDKRPLHMAADRLHGES